MNDVVDLREDRPTIDVGIVGAGMAGLYLIHRLRADGWSVKAIEAADDVGGTWFWNRYPGARCDIRSLDYSFSFDAELDEEWTWSEKYATQPEILRYLQHVTERFDLRRSIEFETRLEDAAWDEANERWTVTTSSGSFTCRYLVMATGCLSVPKAPDVPGIDEFDGPVYLTGRWPHEGVDFTGRRVAVIGTGSSGIQSIPLIAEQVEHLTVFQRTPNFSIPAHNGEVPEHLAASIAADRAEYRRRAREESAMGVPVDKTELFATQMTAEERNARYEAAWQEGTLAAILNVSADQATDRQANEYLAEFIRAKIRDIVDDPDTAELLSPRNHPFGTKRPCLDSGYYATYNRPNVDLVDLRSEPIETVTAGGLRTATRTFEFDDIVLATGFDAMTGAITAVDLTGRDGRRLVDEWEGGPVNYLGLGVEGFPNFFTITGPGSPSVFTNMVVSIEQHVDWIADTIADQREHGFTTIEPTETAQAGWVQHVNDLGAISLLMEADSWYVGANVPGKPRVIMPYGGGLDRYRRICDEVREHDLLGWQRGGPNGGACTDGVIRRLQPDVEIMLELMAEMNLPPLETLTPDEARDFMDAQAAMSPPGPEVGEVIDGTLPGSVGDLDYRLYRPATEGPHPLAVYYHGGGWVLGSATSDDAFCRELCNEIDAVVVSVDYRHGPEARFPAAFDDARAALWWASEHADDLGGNGTLLVAGWSAGGNQAAVVARAAADARVNEGDGPDLAGMMLVTPVTDAAARSASFTENGDGYVLTADLMEWFYDHSVDEADRSDPRISPMRGEIAGLPPTVILTAEFDPLRDEGQAFAAALEAAGVPVTHVFARGLLHTSAHAVGVLPSSAPVRSELFAATRALAHARSTTPA
ncbi:MAG: flavin-containing monooxygenase [Acidimicrobiales bacterium]